MPYIFGMLRTCTFTKIGDSSGIHGCLTAAFVNQIYKKINLDHFLHIYFAFFVLNTESIYVLPPPRALHIWNTQDLYFHKICVVKSKWNPPKLTGYFFICVVKSKWNPPKLAGYFFVCVVKSKWNPPKLAGYFFICVVKSIRPVFTEKIGFRPLLWTKPWQ
jgi:hypothetical protein